MDRVAAQTLRVLGIIAILLVMAAAIFLFLIATAFGIWSSSSDDAAKLVLGIGVPVIVIGGIFLIVKLVKGFLRTSRQTMAAAAGAYAVEAVDGTAQAVVPVRDFAAEEEPLLHLRVAVGARILLSAAILTYYQVQPQARGMREYLAIAVLTFLVYEAPNAFVLWRIRERLERFAVDLAISYAAVGILWTCFNLLRYLRFFHGSQTLAAWLLPVAGEIAILATGWRARRIIGSDEDSSILIAAGGFAIVYTAIAFGLSQLLYRVRPF